MPKKRTVDEFEEQANKVHNGKYIYHQDYVNAHTILNITCKTCGNNFSQEANKHLRGQGCSFCNGKNRLTIEEFVRRARKIHGNKYDYSKSVYTNYNTNVIIICPKHGEFPQTPSHHLSGEGCKECGKERAKEKLTKTCEQFVSEAKKAHKDKGYLYDKFVYVNAYEEGIIICPRHGEFYKSPLHHLRGQGCTECSNEERGNKKRNNHKAFEEKASRIHNNEYIYHQDYVEAKIPIQITCKKCGMTFLQTPSNHLKGEGCNNCKKSKIEKDIERLLNENNIKNIPQSSKKIFDWLGKQSLDFYLPEYNIAIECQGLQHFEARDGFGGVNGLQQRKLRDERKRQLCEAHGVKMIYYANYNYEFPYKVITSKEELMQIINPHQNG